MTGQAALELRGISKRYPGMEGWANRDISLDIRRGEILCIAGENGAGKSTLMKILYGLLEPTEGELFVDGENVRITSPREAGRLGIGMVHQHFMLFPEYTVAQNVVMGAEPRRAKLFYHFEEANRRVREVIRRHGFSLDVNAPVSSLAVGEMQQVEIVKLLYRDSRVIILDEPTAVLADQEIAPLFDTLRNLADAGKAIVLITHKLSEIKRVSRRVAVMRRGSLCGIFNTDEIDEYGISRVMMGGEEEKNAESAEETEKARRSAETGNGETADTEEKNETMQDAEIAREVSNGEAVLVFDRVSVIRRGQKRPVLDSVSFTVHAGEILGFAGVGGNGLGTLEAVLGGFLRASAGRVYHRGEEITALNTASLRRRGLAYVPGDRLSVGSAPGADLAENLFINRRGDFSPRGIIDRNAAASFADNLIARYHIAGKKEQLLRSLSGGNIQKLILAREIEQYRDYIVFSEPAWGLDIAASRFVYGEIDALRSRGAAVIIISANLDELLQIADRIMVFYRGAVQAEMRLDAERRGSNVVRGAVKAEIGAYMLGMKKDGGSNV